MHYKDGGLIMPVAQIANREVISVPSSSSALQAAKMMRQHHVGDIVITDDSTGRPVPIGIVTDRDLVLEILAQEVDPARVTVGDIMTTNLLKIPLGEGISRTIQLMRARGTRRAPVVDKDGSLAGIVCVDDLIELIADELGELANLVARELKVEEKARQ